MLWGLLPHPREWCEVGLQERCAAEEKSIVRSMMMLFPIFNHILWRKKMILEKMIKNTDGPWLTMVQFKNFRLYNDAEATHNP